MYFPWECRRCLISLVVWQLYRETNGSKLALIPSRPHKFVLCFAIDVMFLSIFLQLTESTLFPDGTRVYFRCEGPPGLRYSREGNASLACNDGRWSTRIPFCRPTPTRHNFSGTFELHFIPFHFCNYQMDVEFFIPTTKLWDVQRCVMYL